ncbi:hypothetical protein PE067_16205 [Paracoccus sp. DMF-8]|uniref:hypothetical protein n=1 Tax=Paracoccus sp. DMF-8 TaxID=3019445 RepID=UPI0023E39FAC|nr:hypothetical protein [Paracoccus sp. DMF-8]MDF3607551.1 hypothetical protein [Paracoccus sp. DMF-8]
MIRVIKQSSSMGALNRRFQRDMEFQQAEVVTGPGATAAGGNDGMAIRFGTFPAPVRPRHWRFLGLHGVVGIGAARWAGLSDLEGRWLVIGNRFAVAA